MYKEASFPVTYRAVHVREIMDAIARRRSIAVWGLAGMGKSNVFRFLAAHPQVKPRYLGADAARYLFAFVDCNLIDPRSEGALLQALDAQLERAGAGLPDAGGRARAPRAALCARLENLDPSRVPVILFDPLDGAFEALENHFWSFLRGLRDLQGSVVYVLGARRPPPPLRELQELLSEACWVTPLARADALDSLARDAQRLGVAFSAAQRERLRALSGGHPGLLKNLAEIQARGGIPARAPGETLHRALLARETIREVCRDLCAGLAAEWKTLQWLCLNPVADAVEPHALEFLLRAGLVEKRRAGYFIFSPLLHAYIAAQLARVIRVRVGAVGETYVESWQGRHALKLGDGAWQLLRALAQHPTQVHSRAQLAQHLYLGDPHYSGEAVMAHVKRLRKTLNAAFAPIITAETFNALLPERKQGYRLNLHSAQGWTIEYHVAS